MLASLKSLVCERFAAQPNCKKFSLRLIAGSESTAGAASIACLYAIELGTVPLYAARTIGEMLDGSGSRRSEAQLAAGVPAGGRDAAMGAAPGTGGHAARPGAVRVGNALEPRLLSDYIDHIAAVCDGKRRLGGNSGRRPGSHRRHIALHGRGIHAQPRGGAKCRPG